MYAKLDRLDACLPLAGTPCFTSHYESVWRLGIHAPLLGYPLEMDEIIDSENNFQLTE